MAYERTTWQDEVTPLDAAHFNNMEDGIEEAQVDSDVIDLYVSLGLISAQVSLMMSTQQGE